MERLKVHLFNRFGVASMLLTLTGFSIFLLMLRLKLTQSYFYLFLAWNLFLAWIPFAVTFYQSSKKQHKKLGFYLWFCAWLLFLPNAPYIITDVVHLQHSTTNMLWFDIILLGFFTISGLLLYLISVQEMEYLLQHSFTKKKTKFIIWVIPFFTGFGIYLGRFLRWNSWDIIQRPTVLLNDVWVIITIPMEHKGAWLVTLLFGFGLSFFYLGFKKIPFFMLKEQ